MGLTMGVFSVAVTALAIGNIVDDNGAIIGGVHSDSDSKESISSIMILSWRRREYT